MCKKYQWLWKIQFQWFINLLLQPNWTFSMWNYCALQRQSNFQTTCTKETFKLWHKIYRLYDCRRCKAMYNMAVYSGRGRKHATPFMTTTGTGITRLKMCDTTCMWTRHLQSYLMIYILRQYCGPVIQIKKQWLTLLHRILKVKKADIQTRVSCNLTATMRKKKNVNILMNMDNLWNWPYYKTITDIWGKWTNLTTWQILVHYQMALQINKAIFPPSGIYHSQECYHSPLP